MSVSYIPEHVKCRLWGLAGGRCQYRGCNHALWRDDVTKAEFNSAYIAHIVADRPDGPRGHPEQSALLKSEITNLMLLCDVHHRLVDIADVARHSIERLQAMKADHEARIGRVGAVAPDRQSEVLLYGSNIGEHVRLPRREEAAGAMLPDWYPARDRAMTLSLVNARQLDHEAEFWRSEAAHLRRAFTEEVRPTLRAASPHISVFALAPQPLLMLLGSLLGDLVPAEVYQLHREPCTWEWLTEAESQPLQVRAPDEIRTQAALVLSLSATVTPDRVHAVLGQDVSVWTVTIARPHNDYLRAREQLAEFRRTARGLLDRIKTEHRAARVLHVFPAAPVAVCVELGRVLMSKADLPLRVYDENRQLGGFVRALDLNSMEGDR